MSNKNNVVDSNAQTPSIEEFVENFIRFIRYFQATTKTDPQMNKQIDETIYVYRNLYNKNDTDNENIEQ